MEEPDMEGELDEGEEMMDEGEMMEEEEEEEMDQMD